MAHHVVVSKYGRARVVPEGELHKYLAQGYSENARWLDPDKYLAKLEDIDFSDPDVKWADVMASLQDEGLKLNLRSAIEEEVRKRIREMTPERNERILARIPKTKPTFVEDTSLAVNKAGYDESLKADYKTPEYAKYTHNCQRCSQTFALRWIHNLDVRAKPCDMVWRNGDYRDGPGDAKLTAAGWESAVFDKLDYKNNTMDAKAIAHMMGRENASTALMHKQITKIVAKAGPGACYQCTFAWRGRTTRDNTIYITHNPGAHVFNIVNDNGTVKFIDAQTGGDASEYFDPKRTIGIRPSSIGLTRLDKCRLELDNIDLVCDYEKE